MRIAIAGLGTVGAEVARQLLTPHQHPASGTALELVGVSARDAGRDRGFSMDGIAFTPDAADLAARDDVDCVVELIGGDSGPALDLVESAIAHGKPVVTANKALLSRHGARLARDAEAANVALMAEASVAGGIPCLKMLREGLAANRTSRVSGILNGTCNFILTEMTRTGREFDDVLAEAQDLGYAEADPGFDIDGIDAAHKLSLLAAIAFGIEPDLDAISISGIRSVSAVDIACAGDLGYAIRLLGIAGRTGDELLLSVQPTMVPQSSQLAKVDGPLNAVSVDADPVGTITAIGPGAGAGATASAVLADLHEIADGRGVNFFGQPATALTAFKKNANSQGGTARFYMRLGVYDRPGVLADITAVLRDHRISVESILQHGRSDDGENGSVPVVITTHETTATALNEAVDEITRLDTVLGKPTIMVIADANDG